MPRSSNRRNIELPVDLHRELTAEADRQGLTTAMASILATRDWLERQQQDRIMTIENIAVTSTPTRICGPCWLAHTRILVRGEEPRPIEGETPSFLLAFFDVPDSQEPYLPLYTFDASIWRNGLMVLDAGRGQRFNHNLVAMLMPKPSFRLDGTGAEKLAATVRVDVTVLPL
jgi:hypothetical protein